ncbi:hypothetical protein [Halorubrum sp. PV6]|uniref:hypothetical protein n=1 Tax=Halorubrum sp. PV6 TaxID=634157 RepID=UPI000F8C8E61|nr:hypothetical protein [Halorubrum sp. PV6]
MVNRNPETEAVANEIAELLIKQDYQSGWVTEAIFVTALDLQNNPHIDLQRDHPELNSGINEVWNTQPEWILNELQSNDLPSGFSQSTSRGVAKVVDLNDPILNHEWLMYPGDDFVEVLVRQYYPIICGENSLQSLTQATRSKKNVVRDGTLMLIAGGESALLPLLGLFTLHLVESNIDEVCEEYTKY